MSPKTLLSDVKDGYPKATVLQMFGMWCIIERIRTKVKEVEEMAYPICVGVANLGAYQLRRFPCLHRGRLCFRRRNDEFDCQHTLRIFEEIKKYAEVWLGQQ